MQAVIKTGGKQYLIKEGDKIQIEKTSHEVGTEIGFDQVLYISDEENVLVDAAQLKSFKIKAKVLSDDKGKKLKVFKFRRRKDSKTLNGHRQNYQTVEILGFKNKIPKEEKLLIENFQLGLQAYYNREWQKATLLFDKCKKYETIRHEKDINPSNIYLERIK